MVSALSESGFDPVSVAQPGSATQKGAGLNQFLEQANQEMATWRRYKVSIQFRTGRRIAGAI